MQGIFQKENTDKALKYGIYRHLPTYEKIIRNLVSFYTKNEQEKNGRPKLKDLNIDISHYDTIFIGYPIWWYTYPQIILSFFDQYDLSNKTIIPFVTHGGSGMSGTKEDMEEYLKDENVTVKEGLAVSRTDIEKSQKETVEDWLKELGYK